MKKHLIPVLLLIAALLLTVIAPAETTQPVTCASCGVPASRDPLFETNHKSCDGCGLYLCNFSVYGRLNHNLCSGCGMYKCDEEYDEVAHRKCNGCRELLCISENDHTHCSACKRFVCNEKHEYAKYEHRANWKGEYFCLDYPEEPEPLTPPTPEEEEEEANGNGGTSSDGNNNNEGICPGGCGADAIHSICLQYGDNSCKKYACQITLCTHLAPNGEPCGIHHERICTSSTTPVSYCRFCRRCEEHPGYDDVHEYCSECRQCNFSHSETCPNKQ